MHFTQATFAAVASFLALSQVAVALPQRAGRAGTGGPKTNVCDSRSAPQYEYGAEEDGPKKGSCENLEKLIREQKIFGPKTKVGSGGRTWTSADCQFYAGPSVFTDRDGDSVDYFIGSDDVADLIGSAIQDFLTEDNKVVVRIHGKAQYGIKQQNIVPCESASSGDLVYIPYEIRKPVHGGTL